MTELLANINLFLHDLPGQLALLTTTMGPWIYVLLFAIIFAETGLVVTPLLPGDSLLFAVGALSAIPGGLNYQLLVPLLILAVCCGDLANYGIGRWLGLKLFHNPQSRIFNPAHLARTQSFYQKHGGKTLILARFMPIVRTYAPFVAGAAQMRFSRFAAFSISGGVAWILIFLTAGHFFGDIPQVKTNFHYVIAAILILSVLPAVVEIIRARRDSSGQSAGRVEL